jgi:hypothetical protein
MSNEIVTTDTTAVVADSIELDIPNGYICTVDRSTRAGVITVANALSDAESLADYCGDDMGKHFTLTDVITTPGVRNRTGEDCTNTYLILSDGTILMSQSDGIKRSAQQIVGLFGGDFGDGIEVSVSTKALKNGNTMKTLHFYA